MSSGRHVIKSFQKGALLLLLLTAACEKTALLEGLNQRDANEIMVLLNRNGIEVTQKHVEKQQESSTTLYVEKADENNARELLINAGLPRIKAMGLSEICKDTGLIPTPKMEKCREMLGLKGEIINSLQSIPGVITADVVINVPEKSDFPDPNQPQPRPSASVVLQVDTNNPATSSLDESKVQQFVANAVTGMDIRDVAVIIGRTAIGAMPINPATPNDTTQPANVDETVEDTQEATDETVDETVDESETVSIGGLEMSSASSKKFKMILVGVLLLFMVMSAALIATLLRSVKSRKVTVSQRGGLPVPHEGSGTSGALPEKVDMDALIQETGGVAKAKK